MKTIMVVDDEPDIRATLKTLLESNGYAVVAAMNGDDCLKKLKKVTPDLILLDIMMPGIPVKTLISKIKGIKIAYLSVVRVSETEKEDMMANRNIVAFLEKPFDIDGLLKTIKKILG